MPFWRDWSLLWVLEGGTGNLVQRRLKKFRTDWLPKCFGSLSILGRCLDMSDKESMRFCDKTLKTFFLLDIPLSSSLLAHALKSSWVMIYSLYTLLNGNRLSLEDHPLFGYCVWPRGGRKSTLKFPFHCASFWWRSWVHCYFISMHCVDELIGTLHPANFSILWVGDGIFYLCPNSKCFILTSRFHRLW